MDKRKTLDNKLNKMMNDRRLKRYIYMENNRNNKKKTLVHSQNGKLI